MSRHIWACLLLLGTAALLALAGMWHSSGTLQDKFYVLINGASGIAVTAIAILIAIVAILLKRRMVAAYSGFVALLSGFVAVAPFATYKYRVAITKANLSDVYSTIAARGSPFPSVFDFSTVPDAKLLVSHGYWVAEDRTKFEIYYKVGSDSYTLAYPNKKWEWRDYGYKGPSKIDQTAESGPRD